jgi:hypothetical protein
MIQIQGGPLIKLARIAEMVGDTNTQRVKRDYLEGLKQVRNRYFIPEVAERICQKMH